MSDKIVVRCPKRGDGMPKGYWALKTYFPEGDSVHQTAGIAAASGVAESEVLARLKAKPIIAVIAVGEMQCDAVLAPPPPIAPSAPAAGPGRPMQVKKPKLDADEPKGGKPPVLAAPLPTTTKTEPTDAELDAMTKPAPKGDAKP